MVVAVHLLYGIAGLAMARTVSGAGAFLIGGGVAGPVLSLFDRTKDLVRTTLGEDGRS